MTVYVLLERNDKFFATRRANTGFMDGFYNPPAGKVEEGEDAITAAIREVKEEAGVDLTPRDLNFAHVSHRKAGLDKPYWVDIFFRCSSWEGEPYMAEPHKADDAAWITYNDPRNSSDLYFTQVFSKIKNGESFSTFGWNNEPRIFPFKEAV